jgi:hypothetical protein
VAAYTTAMWKTKEIKKKKKKKRKSCGIISLLRTNFQAWLEWLNYHVGHEWNTKIKYRKLISRLVTTGGLGISSSATPRIGMTESFGLGWLIIMLDDELRISSWYNIPNNQSQQYKDFSTEK